MCVWGGGGGGRKGVADSCLKAETMTTASVLKRDPPSTRTVLKRMPILMTVQNTSLFCIAVLKCFF